jgi:hypothetical protein
MALPAMLGSCAMRWVRALSMAAVLVTEARGADIIDLKPGPNELDLDADGTPDLVVRARRENFNAHGSTHYRFYRHAPSGEWEIVAIEPSPRAPLELDVATTEGADCVVKDVRLQRAKDGRVVLIVAVREFGDSYADTRPVTASWYELRRNAEELPGWTPVYFARTREKRTAEPYCDVGEAFRREILTR